MLREKDIAYESPCGKYWVKRVKTGFEIYKTGASFSTRCGIIGYKDDIGLERAKKEIARRLKEDSKSS